MELVMAEGNRIKGERDIIGIKSEEPGMSNKPIPPAEEVFLQAVSAVMEKAVKKKARP